MIAVHGSIETWGHLLRWMALPAEGRAKDAGIHSVLTTLEKAINRALVMPESGLPNDEEDYQAEPGERAPCVACQGSGWDQGDVEVGSARQVCGVCGGVGNPLVKPSTPADTDTDEDYEPTVFTGKRKADFADYLADLLIAQWEHNGVEGVEYEPGKPHLVVEFDTFEERPPFKVTVSIPRRS